MPGRLEHTPEMARKMLASLWERNLPIQRMRLDELEQAAEAALAGTLTQEAREGACSTAHKLAGSLGMFGYHEGTDAARRIDQHLSDEGPVDAAVLAADVAALKASLPL